jgi:hypothetical protein
MTSYALGRVPSPPDPRDWPIRSLLNIPALTPVLPTRHVDRILGGSLTKRFDQGELGSCVGQSTGLVKRVQERRDLRRDVGIDPVQIWDRSKAEDGLPDPHSNRGTYIRTALEALRTGAPTYGKEWNPRFRIASYFRCMTVTETKAALFATGPLVVGAEWYDSWFDPEPDGTLPDPRDMVGGHAFVFYGYDDEREAFRAANSWGNEWADDGDFWVPYEYIGREVDEVWKLVDAIDVPVLG